MVDMSKVEIPNTVSTVDVTVEWEQPKAKGLFGAAKAFLNATDIDLNVVTFKGSSPVDYVDSKEHRYAHGGRVAHSGDVKRGTGEGGGETVRLELANIRDKDADLTGFAVGAVCTTGNFSKIAGAVARVTDPATDRQLAVFRFDLSTERTGALLVLLRRTEHGWVMEEVDNVSNDSTDWRGIANMARHRF